MISFEDFKSQIETSVNDYNAEGHKVCGGLYTLELFAKFDTNDQGEHRAILFHRWKEVEEKFTRNRSYYVIQHTYRNFDPDCRTFGLWCRGETIFAANKVSGIFKKYFNY